MEGRKRTGGKAGIKRKYQVLTVFVLLGILALLGMGIRLLLPQKEDVSEGRKLLQKLEKRDLLKTEDAVRKVRQEQLQEEGAAAQRDYREAFSGCVIMGDSVASGFSTYNVLDSTNVVAEVGTGLTSYDKQLETVTELKPRCVFLYYGFNDVGHVHGDVELFRQEYADFIIQLRQALPESEIFVNGLFPVLSLDVVENEAYKDLQPYNEAIRSMCKEQGVAFLDNEGLAQETDYAEDGYHFEIEFYPKWLQQMVEGAGL